MEKSAKQLLIKIDISLPTYNKDLTLSKRKEKKSYIIASNEDCLSVATLEFVEHFELCPSEYVISNVKRIEEKNGVLEKANHMDLTKTK